MLDSFKKISIMELWSHRSPGRLSSYNLASRQNYNKAVMNRFLLASTDQILL
jgi:hypothetical protein